MRNHFVLPILSLALIVACAGPARAGEPEAGSDAVVLAREFVRARLAEAARLQRTGHEGVVVTRDGMVFLDGPEIPMEWVEWVDAAASRRARRPMTTDTVVRVGPGTTLALVNLAGNIRVTTWPRNEVRVVAEHDRSDRIITELVNGRLKLGVQNRLEQPLEVEWTLTVPVWLPVQLSGVEGDIDVAGLRSAVRAQTMRGDVMVRSCQGSLEVNSIEGEVHVTDVDGNVTAGSVNNLIRLLRVTGPVEAQTINGDIQLERLASPSIDASSVTGQVLVASPFRKHGRYSFASHSGRVLVAVPDGQNVNVTLSSFNGQVESSLQTPLPAPTMEAVMVNERMNKSKFKSRSRSMRFVIHDVAPMPEVPGVAQTPPVPSTPGVPRAPRVAEYTRLVQAGDPVWLPEAPQLDVESFGGLIRLASQAEVMRAIDAQRAALDSARTDLTRAYREDARARRVLRESRRAPAPPAPTPPRQH